MDWPTAAVASGVAATFFGMIWKIVSSRKSGPDPVSDWRTQIELETRLQQVKIETLEKSSEDDRNYRNKLENKLGKIESEISNLKEWRQEAREIMGDLYDKLKTAEKSCAEKH